MTRICVTMGDPAGVGPELCVRLIERLKTDDQPLLLVGDRKILGAAEPVGDTFASFRYHNHWAQFCILGLTVGLALFSYCRQQKTPRPNRSGN